MDERRKIVIPIGSDGDSKSEQTFFDTQSRKDARPVVPLSGISTTGPSAPGKRSKKVMVIVVALVAAVAAGGAAAVYAYFFRSTEEPGSQAAVQPVGGKTDSKLSWTHTIENQTERDDAGDSENEDESRGQNDRAANDGDPKKDKKQSKRGKQGNKNADSDDPINRTKDELNRIREIFEGPP